MKITVSYYNWDVIIYDNTITFICELSVEEESGSRTFSREYKLPPNVRDINFEMPYIRIEHDDLLTQYKCEGESFIVGDVFEDGECVDSVAAWDFWDEWI